MNNYILEMKNITKYFPGVKALSDVTFNVKYNDIHALVGENGAGKSTLMKVLSGVYKTGSYEGEIFFDGNLKNFTNVRDSEVAGISIIYQEMSLSPNMNITESIFLGNELKNNLKLLDWNRMHTEAKKLLSMVGLNIDPETIVGSLGVGQQQLVEICKAIHKDVKLLILDEPTAALSDKESSNLLNLLRTFQKEGITCIYISHKLDEVFEIADSITVLRDGGCVITQPKPDYTKEALISYMVGRELTEMYPRQHHVIGDVVLEVRNWNVYHPKIKDRKVVDNVNFKLKKGEILGIAGLMGAGRTELMMSLFNSYGSKTEGELLLGDNSHKFNSPREAISAGIGYVPEDRKRYGLVLMQDVKFNVGLASFNDFSNSGLINEAKLIQTVNQQIENLNIRTPSIEQLARNLSGGNQQKVVLSKWLLKNLKVLILDEPTRGIDVAAKVEIYNIMNDLVANGLSVIMISSELPEVLGVSDRIFVMHEGTFVKEFDWKDATQENIMYYATGGE